VEVLRYVLWVFGGLCAAVWRRVSNVSGAWAVMVLLGVGVGFYTTLPICD